MGHHDQLSSAQVAAEALAPGGEYITQLGGDLRMFVNSTTEASAWVLTLDGAVQLPCYTARRN